MIGFIQKFQQPHPFIFTTASIWVPGVLSFFVITMMAPLGFAELTVTHRISFAALSGAVASSSVACTVYFLGKVVPSFMDEDSWTVWKEILLFGIVILVICITMVAIFLLFGLSGLPILALIMQVTGVTLAISFFPVIFLVVMEQWVHQKKKTKEAEEWMHSLKKVETRESIIPIGAIPAVELYAENDKLELSVPPNDIVYLKSDGNYVEIFILNSTHKIEKKLIRNRLKEMLRQLPYTQFVQCHKSFVVNIRYIHSVRGNARNLEIELKNSDQYIPVSRSKSDEIKKLIST